MSRFKLVLNRTNKLQPKLYHLGMYTITCVLHYSMPQVTFW